MVKRITSNASKAAAKRVADAHGGFVAASKGGVRQGDVTVVTVRTTSKTGAENAGGWVMKSHRRTATPAG